MSKVGIGGLVTAFATRLRFPQLFFLTAALFLADLLIPDLIPAVDEILLLLLTALLGSLKKRKEDLPQEPPKNVTPSGS
ncbi:MAG: hypothetical protein KDD47_02035 [Acidobacteria bacterium]|nr:hypothetical protein [Acidobacteriota bacterium]